MKSVTTATYHPQGNGQCERFNRTLLAGLRSFVSEHSRSWPEYAELLAFAYITQTHSSIGLTPFELVLPNPPKSMKLRPDPSHEEPEDPRNSIGKFEGAIRKLRS